MTHRNEEATMIVTVDDLRHFTGALFSTAGVPADDAALAARILTDATVRGVDTHGVTLLDHYIRRLRHGLTSIRMYLMKPRSTRISVPLIVLVQHREQRPARRGRTLSH